MIYNNVKKSIETKFFPSESINLIVIEPKEILNRRIIISKYFIMNYLRSVNSEFGNNLAFQLFVYEFKNRYGQDRQAIESNTFSIVSKFWSVEDDSIVRNLTNRQLITEIYAIPNKLPGETYHQIDEKKLIETAKIVIEQFPNTNLGDWANFIVFKSNYISLEDSIRKIGLNDLSSLLNKTKDVDLKICIDQLIELVQKNEFGKIRFEIEESPYYKEIEYIQANDSFELELQGDNSKYLNLAHYMLKNMPDLLVSEWANYIIDLNLFLSKDESKKVVGKKLLKELGENTRDERLIVRIRKWFLQ